MNDSALIVHKRCILPMKADGITPRSELSGLCSYGSMVSAEISTNGWNMPFRSFLVTLEPAGVFVMNGDGVSGVPKVGGE